MTKVILWLLPLSLTTAGSMVTCVHAQAVISLQAKPASQGTDARVLSPRVGRTLVVLKGGSSALDDAVFSREGTLVATVGADKTARIWNWRSKRLLATLEGHTRAISEAEFSSDGSLLLTWSFDEGTARVWDWRSGQVLATLNVGYLTAASFSRDAKLLLIASGNDNSVHLTYWRTGQDHAVLSGHTEPVHDARFSSDGKLVVTGSDDDTVRVWDWAARRTLAVLKGYKDPLSTTEFSPDGTLVATQGLLNPALRIWDWHTGRLVTTYRSAESFAFAPDSKLLATSHGRTATIWRWRKRQPVAVLKARAGRVENVDFSPDGKYVITADSDGTAQIWSWNGR